MLAQVFGCTVGRPVYAGASLAGAEQLEGLFTLWSTYPGRTLGGSLERRIRRRWSVCTGWEAELTRTIATDQCSTARWISRF